MKKILNLDKIKTFVINNSTFFMLVILTLAYEFFVNIRKIPDYILPAPTKIFLALVDNFEILFYHTKATLYEAFSGLFSAIFLSLLISLIMNKSKIIKNILYPVFIISQSVPIIAIAPVFIVWLGFGITAKIVIVSLI